MTKEQKVIETLLTTISWLKVSANSLEKLDTDEARKHALEMRGAAAIADQWIAEIEKITNSSSG